MRFSDQNMFLETGLATTCELYWSDWAMVNLDTLMWRLRALHLPKAFRSDFNSTQFHHNIILVDPIHL